MKNLFKKIGLPLAVFALAFFGAFQTNAMNKTKKVLPPATGYVTLIESQPCAQPVECTTDEGPICEYLSFRAWGKENVNDMHCTIPLNKIVQ